jgi:hypothetical protein
MSYLIKEKEKNEISKDNGRIMLRGHFFYGL